MNIYKREFLRSQARIKELNEVKSEELTAEEYKKYWYDLNSEFKNYHILHQAVLKALNIGEDTGYFWNKISKKLILINYKYLRSSMFLNRNQETLEGCYS